jgi:hypothetical protein
MARWAPAAEEEVAGGTPDHTGERERPRERERRETERDLREDSIGTMWRVAWCTSAPPTASSLGMKTVRIFSDRIRDRIRLEGF